MKYKILILFVVVGFALQSCTKEKSWSGNDINFPIPVISSVSKTKVAVGDTITLTGVFNDVISVTIGGGFAKIDSISTDSTTMYVKITVTCASGPLVVQNIFKNATTFSGNFIVTGGGAIVIPDKVVILDFTGGGALPKWTKSTWKEAKNFQKTGYGINKISPPVGYKNYYAMDDTTLYPPNQPAGQDGNIPYGNYTSDNNGAGFDISYYNNPYVSVLINTGNDICYLSLVIDGKIIDLQPSFSPGGIFANGEKKHYMQTKNKWMWYTFSLSDIMGSTGVPAHINDMGLFIRNSWDYGAANYPGFQLNIVQMVITNGPLPQKITVFNFENGKPTTTDSVTSWATDPLPTYGLDKFGLTAPQGSHYYSMANPADGGGKNYKFALKSDNSGQGFDLSKMLDPYITFAVNTGSSSGYFDFVFEQKSIWGKDGEPWADPSNSTGALVPYPEKGNYFDTGGKWEWRSYNLKTLLKSVPSFATDVGYPDFSTKFDYILVWPRDGWNNAGAAPPFELNIDDVVITDGIPPAGLPYMK